MRTLILTTACLASLVLGACSMDNPGRELRPRVLNPVVGGPAGRGAGEAGSSRASASVWGAERGLELWTWTVADARQTTFEPSEADETSSDLEQADAKKGERPERITYTIIDPRLSIEQALVRYADRPAPIDEELQFRLHAAGFRVLSVPVADLAALQASLRLVAPTQKQWLGEAPVWTDLVQGPTLTRSRTVAVDASPTAPTAHLPPGRLRLLGRAWIAPLPTGSDPLAAALRLEVVPQHEPTLSEPLRLLAGAAKTSQESEGRVFGRLALGLYLRGEDAIVIVPDSPASDWAAAVNEDAEATTPDEGDEPAAVQWPTMGEAMLSGTTEGRRTRAVVVLIPRVPERFELR